MTGSISQTQLQPRSMAQPRVGLSFKRILIYVVLIVLLAGFLLPVYLVLSTSFKMTGEVNPLDAWKLPQSLNFGAFSGALSALAPYFVNSLILTIPATAISAMLGSMNGYVLSKWRFRGANIIFPL